MDTNLVILIPTLQHHLLECENGFQLQNALKETTFKVAMDGGEKTFNDSSS